MSKTNPQVVLSGLTVSNSSVTPAIDVRGSTMTINSSASIQVGSIRLTEDKLAEMEAMLEFVERFVEEDARAKAIWVAIKAKRRILG